MCSLLVNLMAIKYDEINQINVNMNYLIEYLFL